MTSFNITLELFEKYQPIVDYIKGNEKVLENFKKRTGKHQLFDFAEAYKDGDWKEIRCTW